jgi:hypothetical protein
MPEKIYPTSILHHQQSLVRTHKPILVVTSISVSDHRLVFKNEDILQYNYEGMSEANSDENMQRKFDDKINTNLEYEGYLRVEDGPALHEG